MKSMVNQMDPQQAEQAQRSMGEKAPATGRRHSPPEMDAGPTPLGIGAIGTVFLFFLIGMAESRLLNWLAPELSVLAVGLVTGATVSLAAAVSITRLGLWRRLGFRRPERWGDLVPFWPFAVCALLPLTVGVEAAPATLAGWVIAGLLIAFYKMVILGLLLHSFRAKGSWRAAGLAALVFAVLEVGGVLSGGAAVATGVLGLLYVFLAFAYGAAWLRTGLIWPLVIVNALMTISVAATQTTVEASNVAVSVADVVQGTALAVVLAFYGAVLLRKSRIGGEGA